MVVGFYIKDLTCLRYFIPIIKVLQNELKEDLNISLFLEKSLGPKYNNLRIKENLRILDNIIRLNVKNKNLTVYQSLDFKKGDKPKINIDVLFVGSTLKSSEVFNLDNNTFFSYKKRVVIQHGFDYIGMLGGCRAACENTVYVVTDEIYSIDIVDRLKSSASCMIPEIPVQFWYAQDQKDFYRNKFDIKLSEKIAFILYPESGYHEIVRNHVGHLNSLGFKIFIKQRRKNQIVDPRLKKIENVKIVYDDAWYPSEATGLPLLSDICIGYGSTGYFDICHMGHFYIDCALPPYSKVKIDIDEVNSHTRHPASRTLEETGLPYVKPFNLDNFYYTEDPEKVPSIVEKIIQLSSKNNLKDCKNKNSRVDFTHKLLFS